jgi:hypothetical protein
MDIDVETELFFLLKQVDELITQNNICNSVNYSRMKKKTNTKIKEVTSEMEANMGTAYDLVEEMMFMHDITDAKFPDKNQQQQQRQSLKQLKDGVENNLKIQLATLDEYRGDNDKERSDNRVLSYTENWKQNIKNPLKILNNEELASFVKKQVLILHSEIAKQRNFILEQTEKLSFIEILDCICLVKRSKLD